MRPDAHSTESQELVRLFHAYTAGPSSIGAHLGRVATGGADGDPLIVATGSDIALYPGRGAAPTVVPFRLSARGFKELAAVSHLGPALASLAYMRELGDQTLWRADAERLLEATRAARIGNTEELWRDVVAVSAFQGREPAITAMVDYSCLLTEAILERSLAHSGYLTISTLREEYLEGPADHLPVSFNRVMVATFFLVGLDLAHRLIGWFDGLELPWERAMVIIAGQQGRPTAGVSIESNSVAGVVHAASRGRLPLERLLIAPHAPVFPQFDGTDLTPVAALEGGYREMWSALEAISRLGAYMFDSYPGFRAPMSNGGYVDADSAWVHEKPALRGSRDWLGLITRLRVVMEDPRQLLSGAVTDYASAQLAEHGNDPLAVTVPGLDGEPYPGIEARHGAAAATPHTR
jgi:Domain of unknown function (DUF5624)